MPKKRRQRKPHRRSRSSAPKRPPGAAQPPGPGQAPGPRTGPAPWPDDGSSGELDLLGAVRDALQQPDPLPLLATASTVLAVADPRSADPFAQLRGEDATGPDLHELLSSFIEVEVVETSALLAALAELLPDQLAARRLQREVARRADPLPEWLTGLTPLTVDRAVQSSHVLGDGDNVLVGARTATGHPLTAVVYIDHNFGTLVKDAFVADDTAESVLAQLRTASGDDPDVSVDELDPANARARIEQAIERHAHTVPPLDTDSWPASRALIEWIARHLPQGGAGYVRPEWSEDDREALTERFFASPFGRGHDDTDREMLDSLLWFACDYGPGDPLRWSPVAVEMLLGDWLPRKVIADVDFLARAPALLRSFIRYSHAERGIRSSLTEETLAAVDQHEADYQQAIRSPQLHGPAGLLTHMGVDADELDRLFPSYEEIVRDSLLADVGTEQALADLDTDPLPDEPFAWGQVPDDVHDRVGEVLALLDGVCDEHLDVEVRTACRRLLADIAAADPDIFRRRGRVDTAAAAIAWIVAKANGLLPYSGLTAKQLLGWFGVSGSVSQRADTLLRAVGVERPTVVRKLPLGTPRYLLAGKRQKMVDQRDQLL